MKKFTTFIVLILLSKSHFAQTIYTPAIGSAERKAIMEIIRQPIQKKLKQEVQFIPNEFRINAQWAFLWGSMQQKNGKDIDRSKFLEKEGDDYFWENMFVALLEKKNGQWELVRQITGCTDVCWEDWVEKFKVPKAVILGK